MVRRQDDEQYVNTPTDPQGQKLYKSQRRVERQVGRFIVPSTDGTKTGAP